MSKDENFSRKGLDEVVIQHCYIYIIDLETQQVTIDQN